MNLPQLVPVPIGPKERSIPDIQAKQDTRKLAIDQVGIRELRHPGQGARS